MYLLQVHSFETRIKRKYSQLLLALKKMQIYVITLTRVKMFKIWQDKTIPLKKYPKNVFFVLENKRR